LIGTLHDHGNDLARIHHRQSQGVQPCIFSEQGIYRNDDVIRLNSTFRADSAVIDRIDN
jgi:hypothetical protein